ncbi:MULTISPECIES: hypothetical protein [Actinosynnema]|uniref:hypothetical protein n=1 Tax=Actinosynnema TaxID=40566 RepID=UPI0020A3F591|nr:hypothetical protein [Actinosynnema pretiosum]MCP2095122.1 hypothetical protein [Actinosynnema pretiosum]
MSEPSWGDQGQQGQGDPGQPGTSPGQYGAGQYSPDQHSPDQYGAGQYSASQYDPTQYDPGAQPHGYPQHAYPAQPYPQQPSYGGPNPQHPQQPWQPGLPQMSPPQMTPVQNVLVGPGQRPLVVLISFALWVAASLAWPVGSLSLTLYREGGLDGGGAIMALFFTSCVAIGGVACAVRLLRGSSGARFGLAFGGVLLGLLALLFEVGGADGDALDWFLVVLRLGLPLLAAVLSFLPPAKHHFAAGVR